METEILQPAISDPVEIALELMERALALLDELQVFPDPAIYLDFSINKLKGDLTKLSGN